LELVLVRHGETEFNRADVFRGRADPPLNERGLQQARAAARSLATVELEAAYASPLQRALQTAGIIAGPHGLKVQAEPLFIDVDYGEWSGKNIDEVKRGWPQQFDLWRKDPESLRFPGGESLVEVGERLSRGLESLRERHQGPVLLVGHKVVNRIILCICLGLGLEGIWRLDQSNGAVNIIAATEGGWMLRRMNDVSHLEGCTSPDQST